MLNAFAYHESRRRRMSVVARAVPFAIVVLAVALSWSVVSVALFVLLAPFALLSRHVSTARRPAVVRATEGAPWRGRAVQDTLASVLRSREL
jgi:hypothetical protein